MEGGVLKALASPTGRWRSSVLLKITVRKVLGSYNSLENSYFFKNTMFNVLCISLSELCLAADECLLK